MFDYTNLLDCKRLKLLATARAVQAVGTSQKPYRILELKTSLAAKKLDLPLRLLPVLGANI